MNPIKSNYSIQVGEHLVTVCVEDYDRAVHITAEVADPQVDVPVQDFLCAFAAVYGDFIKKPALLAISGTALLMYMKGDQPCYQSGPFSALRRQRAGF